MGNVAVNVSKTQHIGTSGRQISMIFRYTECLRVTW